MENDLGKVSKEADGFKVRFERILAHNIHTVWDAITNPEKLRLWFTDFESEFRPGSKLTIRFRDEARSATYGEIVTVDKPNKFTYTWEGELAVWELFAQGERQCKLVLTYSKLSDEYAVSAPTGFHSLLDRLEEMLEGSTKSYPFGAEELSPEDLELQERYSEVIYKEYPELEKLEPIVIERTYKAPAERVWKAIADKDQMKHWYFELDDFRPEMGFEFQFYGEGQKGEKYLHLCKITEVEVFKRLTYTWSYKGYEGMSYVTFELKAEGSSTSLKLTHRGLHTFPENPDFAKENFNMGWTELIGKLLKDFVEA